MSIRRSAAILAVLAALPGAALAEGRHEAPIRALVQEQVRSWAADPAIVAAVQEQNARNAGLSQTDVERLDKQWRAETKTADKPLIAKVLANPLSQLLQKVKADGKGLYTEIFVTDAKGLNVGQSDMTSDYWQGDEPSWQKSFLVGPDAVFVDEVEKDESTQMLQAQVSLPIVDPASKAPVGAVTIGINLDELDG